MRELDVNEIMLVDGGAGGLAVAALAAGAILAAAAIAVVAYGASKGCEASAEIGEKGIKVSVDCKKD